MNGTPSDRMQAMQEPTWEKLIDGGSVRWLKYSFGPSKATTLAARLDDATWLVVSPPRNPSAAAFEGLGGDVSALLAPNGYHHMGQAAWRVRFPHAKSYAAKDSLDRLGENVIRHPLPAARGAHGKAPVAHRGGASRRDEGQRSHGASDVGSGTV